MSDATGAGEVATRKIRHLHRPSVHRPFGDANRAPRGEPGRDRPVAAGHAGDDGSHRQHRGTLRRHQLEHVPFGRLGDAAGLPSGKLVPFWAKPPLFFWMTSLSFDVRREPMVGPAAQRARRHCRGADDDRFRTPFLGPAVGLLAGLILASSGLFFGLAGTCILDMSLAASVTWPDEFCPLRQSRRDRRLAGKMVGPSLLLFTGTGRDWPRGPSRSSWSDWRPERGLPRPALATGAATPLDHRTVDPDRRRLPLVHRGRAGHARLPALFPAERAPAAVHSGRVRRFVRRGPDAALWSQLADARRHVPPLVAAARPLRH